MANLIHSIHTSYGNLRIGSCVTEYVDWDCAMVRGWNKIEVPLDQVTAAPRILHSIRLRFDHLSRKSTDKDIGSDIWCIINNAGKEEYGSSL